MIEELDAQKFYRLRDDRTNRLTESQDYSYLRIRLIAEASTVQSFNGQVQLLATANMLARWCRYLEFGFPDALLDKRLRVWGYETLHQRIRAEVDQADPFGDFSFEQRRSPDVQYTLKVGNNHLGETVDFTIDSNGWNIWAGQGNQKFDVSRSQNNPVGPALAACVGVADAFKVATKLPDANRVRYLAWSVFDFCHLYPGKGTPPPISTSLILGNVQMVGVGSVGSAVVYLLAMLAVESSIQLIDHDIVKIENLNRSPLFGISNIDQLKAAVAAHYLQPIVSVEVFNGRYDEFIRQHGRKPNDIDLILPLANEFGVRTYIENNLPPLQIYGTTTFDWGVNYHRHIPLKEDCSICRFPEDSRQASFICSGAQVETVQGEQVDAALPFLSMAAAALTVGDLLKLHLPDYPFTSNFAFIDFKGKLEAPFPLVHPKRQRSGCLCMRRNASIHKRYFTSTRFSSLSV